MGMAVIVDVVGYLRSGSTIFNREGSQQAAVMGYSPRRLGRKSHHPILAALAEAVHVWLRSTNTSAGCGVV